MGRAGTVFVVDDAREVRNALSRVLVAAGYDVRAFESAQQFLQQREVEGPGVETPGCLLLDVRMPEVSGIELQRTLAGSTRARPIVFLSAVEDFQLCVQAMKNGAVDFLTKPIDNVRLFAAIERALQLDAGQRLEREIRRLIEERLETLTLRERQVMTQVIYGRLDHEIAADLAASEKTVKAHRNRVMAKMGVHSVPELVQLGKRVGVAIEPALRDGSMIFERVTHLDA